MMNKNKCFLYSIVKILTLFFIPYYIGPLFFELFLLKFFFETVAHYQNK